MTRIGGLAALGAAALLAGGAFLAAPGCGSTGAGIATLGISSLVGTVATGNAIGSAIVTIKDASGHSVTVTTDPVTGTYTANIAGFSSPFLIEVTTTNTALQLFSIGTQAGTVNVHPYTDVLVHSYFDATGQNLATVFGNPSSATVLPSSTDIQSISAVLRTIFGNWIQRLSVGDPASYDFLSGTLTANVTTTGNELDQLLDISVFTPGGHVTIDGSLIGIDATSTAVIVGLPGGDVSGSSTTTVNGTQTTTVSSTATVSTSQTSTDQDAAIAGVTALFQQFSSLATQNPTATASDFLPLLDPDYLNNGRDDATEALGFSQDIAGSQQFRLVSIDRVLAFHDDPQHPANQTISIVFTIVQQAFGNAPALQQVGANEDFSDGFVFRNQGNGTWKMYGNQLPARFQVQVQADRDYNGGGDRIDTNWQVQTLPDAFQSANVSGNGPPLAPGSLQLNSQPDRRGLIEFQSNNVNQAPASGTVYTFSLTPSPTANLIYPSVSTSTAFVHAVTTKSVSNEYVDIVSYGLNGGSATARTSFTHTYATISGQTLTVVYSTPSTFAVNQVELEIEDSSSTNQKNVNLARPSGSTGMGTIVVPSGFSTPVRVSIQFDGFNGERSRVSDQFN